MHESCKGPSPDQPKPVDGPEPSRPRKSYVRPRLVEYGAVVSLTQGIHSRNRDHFAGRVLGSGT